MDIAARLAIIPQEQQALENDKLALLQRKFRFPSGPPVSLFRRSTTLDAQCTTLDTQSYTGCSEANPHS
jgi:hypothetical protein